MRQALLQAQTRQRLGVQLKFRKFRQATEARRARQYHLRTHHSKFATYPAFLYHLLNQPVSVRALDGCSADLWYRSNTAVCAQTALSNDWSGPMTAACCASPTSSIHFWIYD